MFTRYDFRLYPANVPLSPIVFGVGILPTHGNQFVSVQVNINGAVTTMILGEFPFSAS